MHGPRASYYRTEDLPHSSYLFSRSLCFQVVVAPYGDAVGEEGERQSVAVVTNVESEDLLTSASFPTVVRTPKSHHEFQ